MRLHWEFEEPKSSASFVGFADVDAPIIVGECSRVVGYHASPANGVDSIAKTEPDADNASMDRIFARALYEHSKWKRSCLSRLCECLTTVRARRWMFGVPCLMRKRCPQEARSIPRIRSFLRAENGSRVIPARGMNALKVKW